MTASFDRAAALVWLQLVHGNSRGYINIVPYGQWTGRCFPTNQLNRAADYIAQCDQAGVQGIYLRVTSLAEMPADDQRGGVDLSATLPILWADIDIAGPGHKWQPCPAGCGQPHKHKLPLPADEQAARAIVDKSGLPAPTLWIHSGGGLYPIWFLNPPAHLDDSNRDDVANLSAQWQQMLGHTATEIGLAYGTGVGDLARVLRIPGTVNRKVPNQPQPCRIIEGQPARYSLQDLQVALADALAAMPQTEQPTAAGSAGYTGTGTPPGRDYDQRADWAQILEPHGWQLLFTRDSVRYWTRPGKQTGISATTNALGTDRLRVFSEAAHPFDGGVSYSKFAAYALLEHAGDYKTAARRLGEEGYGDPLPNQQEQEADAFRAMFGDGYDHATAQQAAAQAADEQPSLDVDVTNAAEAADWLRDQIGRGPLAGMFHRSPHIVHTPVVGEDGYEPLGDGDDDDGPAQVRPVNASAIASRIQFTYRPFRWVKVGEDVEAKAAMFPTSAAQKVVDVPDMMPHLRALRGVVHSPILRRDGSVLTAPGYDPATKVLHLPEPGLTVPPIPDRPTAEQITAAVALLDEMVAGFNFITADDKANYYGMLLTPLLRELVPPPYKLGAIGAPQPGSGKTLLADLLRIIHGGVFRAEMPEDDAELRKQITSILDVTTGPVIHFDNVTGTLRSSTLAGLLTSGRWEDRRLGAMEMISRANDRLWVITGNNVTLGGDLVRRTLWVTIDPGVPNPELRTDFAIADLKGWVAERRGQMLAALLTLVRGWVAEGMPMKPRSGDSYARWIGAVDGILAVAGMPGTFASSETARQTIGADDEEWSSFLVEVRRVFGDHTWTVKELLSYIEDPELSGIADTGKIPLDVLPDQLAEKALKARNVARIAKSLGRWLLNREGRWAGRLTVRIAGTDRVGARLWRVQSA